MSAKIGLGLAVLLAAASYARADAGAGDGSNTVASTFAGTSNSVLAKVGGDLEVAGEELRVDDVLTTRELRAAATALGRALAGKGESRMRQAAGLFLFCSALYHLSSSLVPFCFCQAPKGDEVSGGTDVLCGSTPGHSAFAAARRIWQGLQTVNRAIIWAINIFNPCLPVGVIDCEEMCTPCARTGSAVMTALSLVDRELKAAGKKVAPRAPATLSSSRRRPMP